MLTVVAYLSKTESQITKDNPVVHIYFTLLILISDKDYLPLCTASGLINISSSVKEELH